MKSYTDLEQSRKLAKILPINSADMYYYTVNGDWEWYETPNVIERRDDLEEHAMPAWSLAALLEVLPSEISKGEKFVDDYQIDIRKYDGESNTTWYQIAYGNDRGLSGEWHDMINTGEKENIIDCCFQMILKLKEKNLL